MRRVLTPALLILDAQIGTRIQQVVHTGSHDFTTNALVRHDEIWTGYRSPFVISTYASYFDRLYAVAKP